MQTFTKRCNEKLIHSNQIYFTLLLGGNTISEATGLVTASTRHDSCAVYPEVTCLECLGWLKFNVVYLSPFK
jgi:hypothetical protein